MPDVEFEKNTGLESQPFMNAPAKKPGFIVKMMISFGFAKDEPGARKGLLFIFIILMLIMAGVILYYLFFMQEVQVLESDIYY
jgi:hypothetical protein